MGNVSEEPGSMRKPSRDNRGRVWMVAEGVWKLIV